LSIPIVKIRLLIYDVVTSHQKEIAMPRVGLVIEDELHEAFGEEAEKTHILQSELMRMAMREFLQKRGYRLNEKVQLGGKRAGSGRPKVKDDE
jgi:hypothetical protein